MKSPFTLALLFSALLFSGSLLWPAAAQDSEEAAIEGSGGSNAEAEGAAPLHAACGTAAGSEQAVPPADGEGQQAGAGNEEMAAAVADMQRQMQTAVAQDSVDTALACALLAFHRGRAAMAGVQAEHGENQGLKDATERFLTDIEDERQQLIQWLDSQQQ